MNCRGIRTKIEGKGNASRRTKKKPLKSADHVLQSDYIQIIVNLLDENIEINGRLKEAKSSTRQEVAGKSE
jgi:hypothetical protein